MIQGSSLRLTTSCTTAAADTHFTERNLLDEVSVIVGNDITQLPDDHLCDLLLFGGNAYHKIANEMILKCTVELFKQFK